MSIASTLVIPTERPPSLLDIKRALLSYDKVYLPSPDDRDMIPPNAFPAIMGMPMLGCSFGDVRPLGKIKEYDNQYQQLIDNCKPAINQGNVVILDAPVVHQTITIGAVPLPENIPNPQFVYSIYREMAANQEFILAASRGLDNLSLTSTDDLNELAPSCVDDGGMQMYVNGEEQASPYPLPILYNGFTSSDEEQILMTRICLARLGASVKNLAICHMQGLHPYTVDPGIASIIQLLAKNTNSVISSLDSQDEKIAQLNRLSLLHKVIISEFINPEALNELSILDVLRQRTGAWGRAYEDRAALFEVLRKVAIECVTPGEFEKSCRTALKDYKKSIANLEHEKAKLLTKTAFEFGGLLFGSAFGYELVQKLFTAGSIESALMLGGAMSTYAARKTPEIMDFIRNSQDSEQTPGYALFKPYSFLIK